MEFENTVIDIGGNYLYVNNASINESAPFKNVRTLGSKYSYDTIPSSRVNGSINLSFYIHGDGSANDTVMNMISGSGETVKIGTYGTSGAYLQNYSLSARPNTLVEGNATFQFYDRMATGLSESSNDFAATDLMHGGKSVPSVGMFNNNLYEFTYSLSRNLTPDYFLGEQNAADVVSDQDILCTVNLEGSGLGGVIDYPCSTGTNLSLNLRDICENQSYTISRNGMIVSDSSLSLTEERDTVGSVSLLKYL